MNLRDKQQQNADWMQQEEYKNEQLRALYWLAIKRHSASMIQMNMGGDIKEKDKEICKDMFEAHH
ncbi:CLUMA_CG021196, isoform A [Clunio marinus]|uniref:CLUMA_CG021196, isoform A n=1 Tax=Clunio marinus TaxID=568069 RepID=A0A1J1J711_9DIPT|nr:CLUMA_CG021196, isoform A [Clunio marinus]